MAMNTKYILTKTKLDDTLIHGYYIVSRYNTTRYNELGKDANMNTSNLTPESQIPLSPAVFHILLALTDEERHGYGIMQEVKRHTHGQMRLGPGTLYGAIKRLLKNQVIEEVGDRIVPELNEERRRYYRLTDFGLRVLHLDVARLNQMVQQACKKALFPSYTLSPENGGA